MAAHYEYDDWGLVTKMYNQQGETVRESKGFIGDLGTGDGSPGSLQGPEDSNGNTGPDYHPGIGNDIDFIPTKEVTTEGINSENTSTSTEDITSDLVKENPFRYAGYYWDRKTQFYYLQARYYNPRQARFISEDNYEGETINQSH